MSVFSLVVTFLFFGMDMGDYKNKHHGILKLKKVQVQNRTYGPKLVAFIHLIPTKFYKILTKLNSNDIFSLT